jgi:hypothetical protein
MEAAAALWIVLAFWIGLFVLITHARQRRLGPAWTAMLVPTIDVIDWGRREHELHARVAPVATALTGALAAWLLASSRRRKQGGNNPSWFCWREGVSAKPSCQAADQPGEGPAVCR